MTVWVDWGFSGSRDYPLFTTERVSACKSSRQVYFTFYRELVLQVYL